MKAVNIVDALEKAQAMASKLKGEYAKAARSKYLRCFTWGKVKTGKTVALTTLPRPLLIYLFDPDGVASIKSEIDKEGSEIYVVDFNGMDLEEYDKWNAFNSMLNDHIDSRFFHHMASVAIDSSTMLSNAAIAHILKYTEPDKNQARHEGVIPCQSDYQQLALLFATLSNKLLGIPSHFVMTGHETETMVGGRFRIGITLSPASAARIMPSFSEIYITRTEEKEDGSCIYAFQTHAGRRDGLCGTRATIFDENGKPQQLLPKLVAQNYRAILKVLGKDSENKEGLS